MNSCSDPIEISDDQIRLFVQELEFRHDYPIAWGFSGNDETGQAFSAWLKGLELDESLNWAKLRDLATDEQSRMNGQKRRWMRRSETEPNPEDLTDVLIAGFVEGEPQMLEIDSVGRPSYCLHRGFAAIGSGKNLARVSLVTARRFFPTKQFGQPEFVIETETAARHGPQCSPPVRLLRVTPAGVEEVDLAQE